MLRISIIAFQVSECTAFCVHAIRISHDMRLRKRKSRNCSFCILWGGIHVLCVQWRVVWYECVLLPQKGEYVQLGCRQYDSCRDVLWAHRTEEASVLQPLTHRMNKIWSAQSTQVPAEMERGRDSLSFSLSFSGEVAMQSCSRDLEENIIKLMKRKREKRGVEEGKEEIVWAMKVAKGK